MGGKGVSMGTSTRRKRVKKILLWGVVIFLIAVLIFVWVFIVGIKADKTGKFYNKNANAVWIAHEWADTVSSEAKVSELIGKLTKHGIGTLYLHVGPLGEDGTIDPSLYKETVNFVENVKRVNPDMKILAWMGQLRNKINLSSSGVRHNILNMCLIFTGMAGMDGVHFDVEPVWDGDTDFIELLKETGEMFNKQGNGKILSVAMSEFIPKTFVWIAGGIWDLVNYNTEVNYTNVGLYADQIVDMVYDTGMQKDWSYEWLMKEQVIWLTDLFDDFDRKVDLLIGIPAYNKGGEAFNPEVENVKNGLIGILNGLNDIRASHENFTGVAIYPEWEIDQNEWDIYDALWTD